MHPGLLGWGHSTVGARGLWVGAHLVLSQRLLGQIVFPLHLDLHRLRDVRYQEVEDPADGEHHMLGEGTGPAMDTLPNVAFMGPGVDTCFPGVGELKSSSVMAPETTPCFRGPM